MIIIKEEKSEDGNFIIAETTEPFYVGSVLCDNVSYHCQAMEFRVGNAYCGRTVTNEDKKIPQVASLIREIMDYMFIDPSPSI